MSEPVNAIDSMLQTTEAMANTVRDLQGAIEAEKNQWQPIETAPESGTSVDLWHKDGYRITDVVCQGPGWAIAVAADGFTHWMPLPEPPKGE